VKPRVRTSLQKFVWVKFCNASLNKARTLCIKNNVHFIKIFSFRPGLENQD
jgi:hypothetical protein